MTTEPTSLSEPAREGAPVAVVLCAAVDRGVRSVARALAGILATERSRLRVVELDLAAHVAGREVVRAVTSWTGVPLEAPLMARSAWPRLEAELGGVAPAVVVALDPVAARVARMWGEQERMEAPVVGVISGLRLDPSWGRVGVDRLSVADSVQAEQALEVGLRPEQVVPCGVPVCGGFSSVPPDDKPPLRRRFGLPEAAPVVLVVTEDVPRDVLGGALFQLGMVADRATLLFDVARDDEGAELLRRRAAAFGVVARMFGKVPEAPELWAASDLVVARPHLYVEQRCLALRLPLVHLVPERGADQETAAIYVARDIGRVVEHVASLALDVELALRPEALAAARSAIGAITRRSACAEVARMVAQVATERAAILAARGRASGTGVVAASGGEEAAAAAPEGQGPLETIGAAEAAPAQPAAGRHADVAAAEAEASRQVAEHQQEAERWSRRAALAAERGHPDLRREAERRAEAHLRGMHRALAELSRLSAREEGELARDAQRHRLERSFRELEVEQALAELKRRQGEGDA